jgi:group I intron endonuclease
MNVYGIIYLIRNLENGKVYVGQTIQPLKERWKQHCFDSIARRGFPLHLAIRKYGKERFEVSTIAECSDQSELNRREAELIIEYRACERGIGYNVRAGGDGGGRLSEETRIRLSTSLKGRNAYNKGRKMPEHQRLQLIERIKTHHPCAGRVLSDESKAKIGVANAIHMKGRKQSEATREKRGLALKMHWAIPANKEKRRVSSMGRVISEETRAKIKLSNLGQVRSEQTRMNIRQARLNYLQRVREGNS